MTYLEYVSYKPDVRAPNDDQSGHFQVQRVIFNCFHIRNLWISAQKCSTREKTAAKAIKFTADAEMRDFRPAVTIIHRVMHAANTNHHVRQIWVRHSGGPPFRGIIVIITLTLTLS